MESWKPELKSVTREQSDREVKQEVDKTNKDLFTPLVERTTALLTGGSDTEGLQEETHRAALRNFVDMVRKWNRGPMWKDALEAHANKINAALMEWQQRHNDPKFQNDNDFAKRAMENINAVIGVRDAIYRVGKDSGRGEESQDMAA